MTDDGPAGRPEHGAFPTEAGRQTPMTPAERAMIGLAGVALVAGIFIAVSNVVQLPELISTASATPRASAAPTLEPSGTPRPTHRPRALREVALEEATPEPSPDWAPGWAPFGYTSTWVRAVVDLAVRATPAPDGSQLGTIAAGEPALVMEPYGAPSSAEGWMQLEQPFGGGWIATGRDGEPLVERFARPEPPVSTYLNGVASGPDGFLALARFEDPAHGQAATVALISTDGAAWTRHATNLPEREWATPPAWGPAGWLTAVTGYEPGPRVWVYQSGDGRDWTLLGRMPDATHASYGSIIGSEAGYLMPITEGSRRSYWFSDDAVHWLESEDPGFTYDAWLSVVALGGGFYAWDGRQPVPDGDLPAAFSSDGQTWWPVASGPGGPAAWVASIGSRLVGLDLSADQRIRAWTGAIGEGLSWSRDPKAEAAFAGAMVSGLTSDERRAYAFGWDAQTERPLIWIGTDAGFTRSALPADFRGIPRFGVAGPSGVTLVGARVNLRGESSIFWHRTSTGTWSAEQRPVIPLIPEPDPAACPPPPRDLFEFIAFDPVVGVICHSGEPITLRAWSSRCAWCAGPSGEAWATPAWLAQPEQSQFLVEPIQTSYIGSISMILPPDLPRSPDWDETWVEVTGHFDDLAAATCRASAASIASPWYTGAWQVVLGCRLQFVVSSVQVVDGP
ncbi:MAG TPA: hypothetical protein VJA85_09435 [Candidatus Limnocylindria bacterium]|nr:hypothetical protein [Candidatus Limnocylindria bacterium]